MIRFDSARYRQVNVSITRRIDLDLRKRDSAAICASGSRAGVCLRQLGQVRKEAATTDSDGSLGSFAALGIRPKPACKSRYSALPVLTAQMAAARRFSNLDFFGAT